eukprot:1755509-Rhodomonas_salina.1
MTDTRISRAIIDERDVERGLTNGITECREGKDADQRSIWSVPDRSGGYPHEEIWVVERECPPDHTRPHLRHITAGTRSLTLHIPCDGRISSDVYLVRS